MKTKETIIIWSVFLGCFAIDQLIQSFTNSISVQPIVIGGVLGFFSDYSRLNDIAGNTANIANIIVACLLALFAMVSFFIANFIFVYKHIFLRLSASVFLGGLFNFMINYILYEKVLNNIAIVNNHQYMPFNMAVIFMVIGMALLFYLLIIDRNRIFQSNNLRKTLLIPNNKNQRLFIKMVLLSFTGIYVAIAIPMGLYFSLGISEGNILASSSQFSSLTKNFYILLLLIYLLSICIVGMATLILSHRIYGPMYGFHNYMQTLFANQAKQSDTFKVREKDHFKELEKLAEHIRTRIFKKL